MLFTIALGYTGYMRSEGQRFLPEGRALDNAYMTRSLANHGRLEAAEFRRMHIYLMTRSKTQSDRITQDHYAFGFARKFFPTESILTAFLAIPFYMLFGEIGFWLLSVLAAGLTYLCLVSITLHATGRCRPYVTLCILVLGTQTVLYLDSYSPDLIGASLVLLGLTLCRKFPLAGGFVLGITPLSHNSLIVVVPALLFAWQQPTPFHYIRGLFGAGIGLTVFAFSNLMLWAGFFSCASNRIPYYHHGRVLLSEQKTLFSIDALSSQWWQGLFSAQNGVLTYNVALYLIPLALFALRDSGQRLLGYLTTLSACTYLLVTLSAPGWSDPLPGHRLLFASMFLLLVPVNILLCEKMTFLTKSAAPFKSEP
jgi:hypothetical protein